MTLVLLSFFQELFLGVVVISAVLGILAIIGIWEKDNKKYFGLGEKTQETKLKDYWKVIKGNKPLQVLSISAAFVKFKCLQTAKKVSIRKSNMFFLLMIMICYHYIIIYNFSL